MLEDAIRLSRLASARLRAHWWAFRGATLGFKVAIGAGCRLENPSAVTICDRATLEDDVWLKVVSAEARLAIGAFTFLGRGTELDIAAETSIGEHVLIAPRVFITDHTHRCRSGEPISRQGCDVKPVRIGDDVWIGTGATILCGVTIGDGAVIGAGAVVRKDVPPGEVWGGVPARRLRNREPHTTTAPA